MGDDIDRYVLMGDAISLTDIEGETFEAPRVDLIGEVEEMDHADFNGEADGVLEGELEREPSPHFVCPGTVIGAVDHAW